MHGTTHIKKKEYENLNFLIWVATVKGNKLGFFKDNATNTKIKGESLKYYVLGISVYLN
jgi:hypothetical protein